MDVLILVGAAALAWLAWKYPGRQCRSKFCNPGPKMSSGVLEQTSRRRPPKSA